MARRAGRRPNGVKKPSVMSQAKNRDLQQKVVERSRGEESPKVRATSLADDAARCSIGNFEKTNGKDVRGGAGRGSDEEIR